MIHQSNYSCSTHLIEVRGSSLQLPSHHKYSLEGSQDKVIVVLPREMSLSQFVQHCHLLD